MEIFGGFLLGIVVMFCIIGVVVADIGVMKFGWSAAAVFCLGSLGVLIWYAPEKGIAVKSAEIKPGEYRVLDMTMRDRDENAYFLIEDKEKVRLISVPRNDVEGKKAISMMRIEATRLIPGKVMFQ